ncbi:MAG: hypothetical protein ACI841_001125 [Planctomycetota bacterium]|jgi:hypothetical protein
MSRILIIASAFTLGISAAVVVRSPSVNAERLERIFTGEPEPVATPSIATSSSAEARIPAPAYASLVPSDTFLFLEFRSMNKVDTLVSAIQPDIGEVSKVMFSSLLAEFNGDASALDPNKPVVVAVGPGGVDDRGTMAAILPVPAPTAFASSLTLPPDRAKPLTRPGYIGISDRSEYSANREVAPILHGITGHTTFLMRVRPSEMGNALDEAIRKAAALAPAQSESLRQFVTVTRPLVHAVEEIELSVAPTGQLHTISLATKLLEDSKYLFEDPEHKGQAVSERTHELYAYADPRMVATLHMSWDDSALLGFSKARLAEFQLEGLAFEIQKWLPLFGGELLLNFDYSNYDGPFAILYAKPGIELQENAFAKLRLMLPLLLTTTGTVIEGSEPIDIEGGLGLRLHCSSRDTSTLNGIDPTRSYRSGPIKAKWDTGKFDIELVLRGGHMAILIDGNERRRTNTRDWFGIEQEEEAVRPDWISETSNEVLEIATYGDGNAVRLVVMELGLLSEGKDPEEIINKMKRMIRGRRTPFYTQLTASGADLRFDYQVDFEKVLASQVAAEKAMSINPFR